MKLSVKAKYGLSACIQLAENYQKGNLTVSQLSTKAGTSEKFLEQIMAMLKKAEIVTSTRGAFGGYTLAKSPKDTTVGEILRCLEDNLQIVDCLTNDCKCETVSLADFFAAGDVTVDPNIPDLQTSDAYVSPDDPLLDIATSMGIYLGEIK